MTGDDTGFTHLGDDVVHEGYAMAVAVGRFRSPEGDEFTRDVIRHRGAVAVLPLHDDGTVTVVRQYRGPIDSFLIEIPAGLRDVDHEPTEVTATRELAEEVGLAADQLTPICRFHNAAGLSDEMVHIYLATGLRAVDRDLQGVEERHMAVERHPLGELVRMVTTGEITDAKTIIAVLLADRD